MKYKRTIQQVRVLAVLLCLAAFLMLNSIVHLPASSVHWITPMPRLCPSWP